MSLLLINYLIVVLISLNCCVLSFLLFSPPIARFFVPQQDQVCDGELACGSGLLLLVSLLFSVVVCGLMWSALIDTGNACTRQGSPLWPGPQVVGDHLF